MKFLISISTVFSRIIHLFSFFSKPHRLSPILFLTIMKFNCNCNCNCNCDCNYFKLQIIMHKHTHALHTPQNKTKTQPHQVDRSRDDQLLLQKHKNQPLVLI
jgi:hypothetical protein